MSVRRSPRPTPIAELVDRLSAPDPVVRYSAAARLIVAGEQAAAALHTLITTTTATTAERMLALRTLSAIHRLSANDLAAACLRETDEELAAAAADVLADSLLDPTDPAAADSALEHVTREVLDPSVPTRARLLLVEVLSHLPVRLRKPVFDALAADTTSVVAARAVQAREGPRTPLERWSDDECLPVASALLADAIHDEGARIPVTVLRRLVELVGARERTESADARDGWHATRGLLHQTLAERGSVIARYDLRETLQDATQSLDTAWLIASRLVGDETCLEPVARRWVAAGDDQWLRDQLALVFRTIVGRERVRRDAAVMSAVLTRLPAAGPLVALAPRRLPAGR